MTEQSFTVRKRTGVRAAAWLTALMGVVNLLSVTTPALRDRVALLRQILPLEVRFGSHLAATLSGFALLLLARGLARRKQASWSLSVLVLLVSAASHLLKGLDWEEALLSVGLALGLLRMRGQFHALSDRPSVRRALWLVPAALGFSFTYGVLGVALLDRHFSVDFDFPQAVRQVFLLLTQFSDPGLLPVTRFGHYFADSISMVMAATLGYALLALAGPVLIHEAASPAERARAQEIVQAHGASSLAWFALSDDKSYYFSPGGSLVAFVVCRGVCLALGDVIGPPQDRTEALSGFRSLCAHNDWHPAFVSAEPEGLAEYRRSGFEALCLGHEAVVPLDTFSLAGGRHKDLRGRVARLRKLDYTTRLHEAPLCPELQDELRAVSDEWLEQTGSGEGRFFMGTFEEAVGRGCSVMAVHGPDGAVCAFANLYPEFCRREGTVDLMRRRARVENGTMEMLFVALFDWSRAEGHASFNLGLCPLAGVGRAPSDPATERALGYLFDHHQRFYNFQGMYGFKAKFHPDWSPRYLLYPGAASLLPVTLALIQVSTGDNFLRRCFLPLRSAPSCPPAAPVPSPGV